MFNLGLAMALPPPMLRTACGLVADAEEVIGNKALIAGKAAVDLALKPIAIVGGLKAAAVGTGMKIGGGAIKFVGEKMAKDGAIMYATGAGVKGAGLGVAALGLKPAAVKIVEASQAAEGVANKVAKDIGDTSIAFQTTLDSPLLGHHHKELNVTAGLETALKHEGIASNEISQQQQQEAATVKRAAPKIDVDAIKAALNLVREAKMEDCISKAICELNCNPQGFGQDGKQVFMNMVRLQGAQVLEQSESKSFHEAASKGRQNSGKCEQCAILYPNCTSKSSDLIKMASHIKMD